MLLLLLCCARALAAAVPAAAVPAPHAGQHVRDPHGDTDMMPGWMGSDYQPPPVHPESLAERTSRMEVLDADARIFLFRGFLSHEECDYLRAKAEPRLTRSGVVSDKQSAEAGGTATEISDIRTSYGMFFDRGEDDVIKAVEERIAAWTLLPAHNGEGLQVLKYGRGQKYDAHWDYFFHADGIKNGGNRYATVLTYLTDVEEGGETVFPNIAAPGGENKGFSECARRHLAVKPHKGDAVLFHSIAPTGALERKSLHTACPVIKGTKYSMAKWIHVGRYATADEQPEAIEQSAQPRPRTPGACEDLNEFCDAWATGGECAKNAEYMIGTPARPGACLKACDRCDLIKPAASKADAAAKGAAAKQAGPEAAAAASKHRRAR